MARLLRDTFTHESELCVIRDQPLLAGEHEPPPALCSGILHRAADQLTGKPAMPVRRDRILADDHLPLPVLVVHIRLFVHHIGQIRFICHKAVDKGYQQLSVKTSQK